MVVEPRVKLRVIGPTRMPHEVNPF